MRRTSHTRRSRQGPRRSPRLPRPRDAHPRLVTPAPHARISHARLHQGIVQRTPVSGRFTGPGERLVTSLLPSWT
jgi:hypothetical protein